MKILYKSLLLLAAFGVMAGCGNPRHHTRCGVGECAVRKNSIYHWKTVFNLDSASESFLEKHNIRRVYLRMFDVAVEPDLLNGTSQVVPIATTRFASRVPENVEIVPVAYITIDALRAMAEREPEFASLIVERLLAMSSYNKCGKINEIQLDCDWTKSTKSSYVKLCEMVKYSLSARGLVLSITVRLHQLKETPPPADRGVLMLYNTGALKNPATNNSILNYDDVKPYVKPVKYMIPLDYAFPVFGWGVKFRDNKFVSIVSCDNQDFSENEFIRYEWPTPAVILDVKELVEQNLGKPERGNILYHLDELQLKNYTDNEISQILCD